VWLSDYLQCYNSAYLAQIGIFLVIINIRYAEVHDNCLLAEAGRRLFYEAFADDNRPDDVNAYLTSAFHPQVQATELADPTSVTLIAEIEDNFAGYARLKEGRPSLEIPGQHLIEFVRIYAEQQYIGKGVGSTLMHACLEEANLRGCDSVWLGVWTQNQRAIRFYEKWGFVIIGTQEFRLGKDIQTDHVMYRKVKE
jgi:diamine N-acetyltransferase